MTSFSASFLALLQKELLLDWRGRAQGVAMASVGAVSLLLFSLALGPDFAALRRAAAGMLLLALFSSSVQRLNESFRAEHEMRALEGLRLLPVESYGIFYAKAVANTLSLLLLAPVLIPVAVVLFDLTLDLGALGHLALLWFLVAAGLAAPGTLYAAMTSQTRGQDVLLPLLLFPLVVPVLLGAVKAFGLALSGDPMGQADSWAILLMCFDLIYWLLGGLLFDRVLEELGS